MKGIGVYGAEIKVGGFSGYLCELLVLNYGSFAEVSRAATNWEDRITIDYAKHYERKADVEKTYEEPLVMIDPVDKGRNVAAAVRKQRYDEFVAASRAFMKNPNVDFFYPPETSVLSSTELVNILKARGSTLVFVSFNGTETVPDVLWGQLYRQQRTLRNKIRQHDFMVLGDTVWSNEKDLNVFVFEIENRFLPNLKRHLGPPLKKKQECENFLQKHLGADSTVSGPRLDSGRWVVDVKRNYTDVAELVAKAAANFLNVIVNNEVLTLYSSSPMFAKFLTEYLEGKPRWLVGV
jgi:tRNA nucleotidyltransferase (CCA-adding enzyme)